MEKTIINLPDKVQGKVHRKAIFRRLTCDDFAEVIVTEFDEITYSIDDDGNEIELHRERKNYVKKNAPALLDDDNNEIQAAQTDYTGWDLSLGEEYIRPSLVNGISQFYGLGE